MSPIERRHRRFRKSVHARNICTLPMRRTEQKFLFYDFELYVDELYNNIILYFQFFLTQIHEIIASCLFYEKYLTENDKKKLNKNFVIFEILVLRLSALHR